MGDSEIDTDELSNSEEFISDQSFETPKKKRYRRRIYFDSLPRKKVKTKTSVDVTTHVGIDHHVDSGTDSDVSSLSNTTEISSDNDCESNTSFSEYMLSEEIDSEEDHSRYECDSGDKETRHQNSSTGKLFESSILSKIVSSVLIISFVMKYGLGKEAFKDLLTLISLHLPLGTNNGVSTIHKLKKLLGNYLNIPEPRSCYYCSKCQRLLKNEQICQLCVNSSVLEFADLDFKRQLSDLLKDDNFRKELKPRNANNTGDALSDITDGSEYKRLTEEFKSKNPFSTQDTLHLTFTLNTDGVALFSSTKKGSLWPIYLAVNELPVKLRFTKKYLIPCYLFCQIEKPNMISYLQPLVTTLKSLHFQGFSIPTNSGVLKVFGHLLAATLDLPAKAMVANMKQFNGKSACSVCLDTGVPRPNLPMLRYYPFDEESELRSQDSWLRHAQDSTQSPDAVCGIKGTSALASLNYVDLPKLFVIDWMHCVLLGVVKALMKCWFVGPRGNEYYIGDKISFLNRKLQAIKVPDFVARTPRTLAEHAHWKASECREWLFHFSIPLLSSVMKPLHLSHYALLVTAMVILNQETIEMGQLMHAEEMILDFCRIFPEIYGNVKQTMNMHLLRHLPHFVRLHGPLFTTSCFGFESMNSHLKKMVHGTRHVTKQVSFAVNIAKSLPGLVEDLTKDSEMNTKVKDYLQSLTGHSDRLDETAMEDVILGKKKRFQPDDSFLDSFNLRTKTLFHKFFRLQTPKGVFYSQQYDRVKCRNSYSVLLDNQIFGTIEYFLEADAELFVVINVMRKSLETFIKFDQNCQHHSILKKYMNQQELLCHHITPVSLNTKRQLFPVSHLRCKCIYMSDDSKENIAYMSVPPNLVEHS